MDVTNLAKWSIEEAPEGVSIANSGKLTVAGDAAPGKVKITANYDGISSAAATITVFALSKEALANSGSIKEKFGITTAETPAAVKETFTALYEFIKAGGLTNENTNGMIELGDWIDLEDGLKVDPYGVDQKYEVDTTDNNKLNVEDMGEISLNYNAGDTNQLLRLIVVGINSFHSDGTYNKTENDDVDHVVFQFKNIPGMHIMNQGPENISSGDGYNTGGYAASEMRKYLVPVYMEDDEQVEGSGNFLTGLVNAGVPKDVLWGPTRYVATVGRNNTEDNVTTINDLLWLPTRFEMTGSSQPANSTYSMTEMLAENNTNQVRLEYYPKSAGADSKRVKLGLSGITDYWLSSTNTSNSNIGFAEVWDDGSVEFTVSSSVWGVVPAFCVW
jgi:hypothetical protein